MFDFTKWDFGTWGAIMLIMIILWGAIGSIANMYNNHELKMAKVECENSQTME